MNPTLVAIDGPAKGKLILLGNSEELAIGREISNGLALADAAVSRRHCVIQRVNGAYAMTDSNSRNGTFVNGIPICSRELSHGDEIRIGTSLFMFLADDEAPPPAASCVELDDASPSGDCVTLLRVADSLYTNPTTITDSLPATERIAHNLNALLAISKALQSVHELEPLERTLLQMLFDALPAERAAVLLSGKCPGQFDSMFALQRGTQVVSAIRINPNVMKQVIEEGVAVMTSGPASRDSAYSMIAVRLSCANEVLGVLYADASDCGVSFDKEHLRLFTGICSIAALAISNVRTLERLQLDNQRLIEEVDLRHDMVGESQAMRDVYRTVSRVAPMGTTVLITGESGTGKELVARAIHRNSARSARAFVPINCAAISEGLLESELFGHERGAFTGAFTAKKGKFEVADGGTLFLDEIGDMAPGLQAKLLRVLQDQRVDRVGGVRPVQVDVRIIAASNRNLEEAAAHGGFRQDLYFRLNTLTIRMPSLRERRDDIPLLARYFAVKAAERCNRKITGISEPAMALLAHYDWPGNVRELEHAIERAIILGVSDLILPEDLPECILESEPALAVLKNTYQGAVNEAKRQVISRALEQTHWVYTEAAKLLGVHPVYLHRLMRKMNLKSELKSVDFRPPSRQ